MIIFRPTRGSLDESIKEAREFKTIRKMKSYILRSIRKTAKNVGVEPSFDWNDIIISEETYEDDRIGWKNTMIVSVKRCGNKVYDTPICIGYCATKYIK